MILTQKLVDWLEERYEAFPTPTTNAERRKVFGRQCARALLDGSLSEKQYSRMAKGPALFGSDVDESDDEEIAERLEKIASGLEELTRGGEMPATKDVYGDGDIRVKKPSERYSNKAYQTTHKTTGQPVFDERGREVALPTEQSSAFTGVLVKHLAYKNGVQGARLTEHEEELLEELCTEKEWAGNYEGDYCKSIRPNGQMFIKALLDDTTSGGLEITPIEFDDGIITTPQLHSELYPFVDRKEVTRGRRIEGGYLGNVTVTSGEGADNAEMSLFSTASLVSAINTTVHSVGTAVEIGRDFMSDAAVDVGRLVQQEVGQSYLAWIDEQIAVGDGTTEPEGILNASGTTAVAFANSTSVGAYESLLFSIPKAQRPKGSASVRFGGTEVSYQRMKALSVGAGDARRVFGGGFMGTQSHEDFMCLGRPYAISAAMSNSQLFFGDLMKYRMYRRKGMGIEMHTQGSYLARRNLVLLVARGRMGGRVMLGSSFGVVTDAPA